MIRNLLSMLICLAVLAAGLPLTEIGKARASHDPMVAAGMGHGPGHVAQQSPGPDCPADATPCCDGWRAACPMHASALSMPVPAGQPRDWRSFRRVPSPQDHLTGIDPDIPYEPPRG